MKSSAFIVILVAGLLGPIHAMAEDSAAVRKLREQAKAVNSEKQGLERKLNGIRSRLDKSPELEEARKARADAYKTIEEKEKGSPELQRLRKAEAAAREELYGVIKAKVDEDRKVRSARKTIARLRDDSADLELEKAIAELKLSHRSSPIQRELAADKDLQALRRKAYEAGRDSKEAKAYRAAHDAKLAGMRDAQKLRAEIDECKEEIAAKYEEIRTEEATVNAVRMEIERGDDPDVAAARMKHLEARRAYGKASNKILAEERNAEEEARTAYYKARQELLEADSEAKPILAKIKSANDEIGDLNRQIGETIKKERAAAQKK